jgi:arylsulfatase A-like enzyme
MDGYNVVFIQLDSLSRHFLRTYGNDWVDTSNLSAFAQKAAVFDQHYVGSLPCMPARREIWTGTEEFWWRPWGPLEPWDRPLAHLCSQNDIPCQLITDHYHLFEWGAHGYAQDFRGFEFIRGHEYDNWRTERVQQVPEWAQVMLERHPASMIYLRNVQHFKGEDDFFAPKVMKAAREWLESNHGQKPFYLHVDCFDVHEPFHVPEPYRSLYTDDDFRKFNPWPPYGRTDNLTDEEIAWLRAQFAGKLTMVDVHLGRVFEVLEKHDLWKTTCVIITTDHGHYLGEHGFIGKPAAPLYHTLCHIPLFIWHPAGVHNGTRVQAISQTVDLYATVLELLGLEPAHPEVTHSRSLVSLLEGQSKAHRAAAVYGYCGERVGITDSEWTLLRDHDVSQGEGYWYSAHTDQLYSRSFPMRHQRPSLPDGLQTGNFIPGVLQSVWRMKAAEHASKSPRPDLLFHNPTDPEQHHSIADPNPRKVAELQDRLRQHLRGLDAPLEQRGRLRL